MDTREGTDITKGGVVLLLVVLVMSTTLSLVFYFNTRTNDFLTKQTEAATSSHSATLLNLSYTNQVPAQSVYTALTQFNDNELEFIAIVCEGTAHIYTYETESDTQSDVQHRILDLTDDTGNKVFSTVKPIFHSSGQYITHATAFLHTFLDRYANVYYVPAEVNATAGEYHPSYVIVNIVPRVKVGDGYEPRTD